MGGVPPEGTVPADGVIAAPALPIIADLAEPDGPGESVERLQCLHYPVGVYPHPTFVLDCSKHFLRRGPYHVAPEKMIRFQPDRFTWMLVALASLGAAFVLARQVTFGVGLTWDPLNYIVVARNLVEGNGFVQLYADGEYTRWPPLYPVLLAAASLFFFDPLDTAGPVGALAFGLTVFAVGQWARQRFASRILVLWVCLAVAISYPLTSVAAWAFTEVPFILFTSLSLIWTDRFLHHGRQGALIWAAIFAALACLTRYVGPSLILVVLPLVMLRPGAALRDRTRQGATYAFVALFPICLWMLRNFLIEGRPTGRRTGPRHTFIETLDTMLGEVARGALLWDLWNPSEVVRLIAIPLAGVAVLIPVAVAGYAFVHSVRKGVTSSDRCGWISLAVFGGYTLAHLLSIMIAASVSYVMPLGGRMLAPACIPLLLATTLVLDRLLSTERHGPELNRLGSLPLFRTVGRTGKGPTRRRGVLLALPLALWLVIQVLLNARDIRRANTQGLGFASRQWADSEVLRYMREAGIRGTAISSSPVTYLYTAAQKYSYLPRRLPTVQSKLERVGGGQHLVWFHTVNTDDYTYGAADLRGLTGLEVVAELSDGIIFRIGEDASPSYPAVYRSITSMPPVARAAFDLYVDGDTLTYVKAPCGPADTVDPFFLHPIPAAPHDRPDQRSFDFDSDGRGVRFDGKCLATVRLPGNDLTGLRTGQYTDAGVLWQADVRLDAAAS